MIKSYLKVALRYLLRHKSYAAINILGLAVGTTCCILIMLFVKSEFSYDKFHSKAGRIFRVWQHEKYESEAFINTVTPLPMAAALQANYPEIETTCRVFALSPMIKVDQNSFSEDVRMVDSSFFNMFDFKLETGDRSNIFPTLNSIVITDEIAKKYFGNTSPMGRNMELQLGDEKINFSVSGIVNKSPEASSIKYKMLIPAGNTKHLFSANAHKSWFNVFCETYVLLHDNVNAAVLENKFPAMMKQQLGEDYKEGGFMVHLQPITDIHLNTSLPAANEPISDSKYSYILGSIGILILLVACINFITLSIGRSTTRAMEVGVRKVMGANRMELVRQFWGESFLITLFSVLLGIALAAILMNPFNEITNKKLSFPLDISFFTFCLLMIIFIAFIAGIYPAIILSRFNPVEVLKGKLKIKTSSGWLRESLIVGQFVASIVMIVCTIGIGRQLKYLNTRDLGFNKEQVVVVPTNKSRKEGMALAQLYRTELLRHPEVADVSVSLFTFKETPWVELGFTDEKRIYHSFQYNTIDNNFIKTMKIQLASGRSFAADNPADINSSALVNEAFVKAFDLKDPIGKKLPGKFEQQIIGVVKDFNYQSLHTKVLPLLMTLTPDSVFRRTENVSFNDPPQPRISVRLRAGNYAANINILKQAWQAVAPNQDFEYDFLDEYIAAQYRQEQRTSTIVKIAAGLSVFIACMGLFGLATLTVLRRTREIGIRKLLGANVSTIVALLSKDFIRLVIIAGILSAPLAWWAMNTWLKDFAYRVSISWWIFLAAGGMALLVALFTVAFQAIKAAIANPVTSLRTE